jgi:hypothetical protein|tara:strand:- start:73 stop:405 length:333 start_codon:yes stop_codon:yes gene_type:complete
MGVLEELTGRLELGISKYNHGVRVDDDTRDWGTPWNSWLHMAREEFLDAMIYIAADYIRISGMKRDENEVDDNKRIMYVIDHYSDIDSAKHKMLLWNLFNMLDAIKNLPK